MSDIEGLMLELENTNKLYVSIRQKVINIANKSKKAEYSKQELCDLGFLCREIVSKTEEIRKDISATKSLVDKILCIKAMNDFLNNPDIGDNVKGTLCSGSPHYKKSITMPRKDTPEYLEMMQFFGVTEDGVNKGVAKISWKKVCDYVSNLAELGRPIPKFIPKVHDDYTVIHRRRI